MANENPKPKLPTPAEAAKIRADNEAALHAKLHANDPDAARPGEAFARVCPTCNTLKPTSDSTGQTPCRRCAAGAVAETSAPQDADAATRGDALPSGGIGPSDSTAAISPVPKMEDRMSEPQPIDASKET